MFLRYGWQTEGKNNYLPALSPLSTNIVLSTIKTKLLLCGK